MCIAFSHVLQSVGIHNSVSECCDRVADNSKSQKRPAIPTRRLGPSVRIREQFLRTRLSNTFFSQMITPTTATTLIKDSLQTPRISNMFPCKTIFIYRIPFCTRFES
jgi:hypothetical protein